MKGQVSVETVMVVAFSFLLIIPSTLMLYEFMVNGAEDIKESHIARIGQSFQDNANMIYRLGNNARVVVKYDFPDFLANMSIDNNRVLVMRADTGQGPIDYSYPFDHNVTATFTTNDWIEGDKTFEFRSTKRGEVVSITRIN